MARRNQRSHSQKRPKREKTNTRQIKLTTIGGEEFIVLRNGVSDINWLLSESSLTHIIEGHALNTENDKSRFFTNSRFKIIDLLTKAIALDGIKSQSGKSYFLTVHMGRYVGEKVYIKRGFGPFDDKTYTKTKWLAICYRYNRGVYTIRSAYPCKKPKIPK